MKRIATVLGLLTVLTFAYRASAQETTNLRALQEFSKEKEAEYQKKKAEALEFARQNDIPVSFQNEEGTFFELQFIDDFGRPQYYITHNVNSAATIATGNVLPGGSSGLNLDGSGITPRQWDAGAARPTHQEFGGRVVMGDGASTNHYHSTHTAGTIMASGIDANAKGMAPAANLRAFDWSYDESEMASEAAAGALMSNHSYGYGRGWVYSGGWQWYGNPSISEDEDYLFGFYESQAQSWDQIAVDAPYYLIVKSAGNDRGDGPTGGQYPQDGPYDCIGHAGISKNIMTVGAVEDIPGGYNGPTSVVMSSFSSWGPADDGRIKPDIVANGISLYSTDSGSDNDYVSLSGTSMAAPSVTGSLALLQEYWENENGSGNYMRAATLKGLVIATADEAGGWDGPDYEFGWGLMNTEKAAEKITEDQTYNVIDELTLADGSTYTRTVTSDGTEPLKVTVCWTDPPGTPVSAQLDPIDPMLVNDLDLRLTYASNTFYPWKMDRDNPTVAATNTGENNVDNVEVVYIDSPVAGDYTITVDHDGTLTGGTQAFSIIIDGVVASIPPVPPVADFTADETTPETMEIVHFYDLSNYNPDTWNWSFSPSTVTFINGTGASSQNPEVTFDQQGTYDVTLTVTNQYGSDTEIKYGYVVVTDPVPFSLPWIEDFEGVGPVTTFTENTSEINDLEYWSYEKTADGRLRFDAGSGYYYSGSNAATLDAYPAGAFSINYLIASISLFDYSTCENLELSFYYMNHGEESSSNDRVWMRGSDADPWIEIYDLYNNRGTPGVWKYVSGIDIDAILAANGQNPTQTFQLRFGQEDNYPSTSTTASDGFSFDDVKIEEIDPSQYIISTFPYSQSWEDGMGLWCQATDDDFDWTRNTGGTPSSGTGPTSAHDGSYYLYTEASSPRVTGDYASISASFDFTGLTSPTLSFYYHMAGTDVGSLHVDVYDGSAWNNDVWSISGTQQANQSDPFENATIDLSAWEGMCDLQIRIRGIVGNGGGDTWSSDIAIDLIEVTGNSSPQPPSCTNPVEPLDGAVDVLVTTNLSWDGVSNADGYYIYFGTDNPPTNLENGTDLGDVTSYDPGTMDYSTDHYWKIVPYNSVGSATSCATWTFTTETLITPPGCTNPVDPVDGATDVLVTTDITWDAVPDADGYKIYIGFDYPPANLENGTDLGNVTTYTPPASLEPGTVYYWKIIPYNAGGDATGCSTWSFTTMNVPQATIPIHPPHGSINISVDTTLSWVPVPNATGYFLYFGTDNPPSNLENGTDLGNVTSYSPTGGMLYQTDHFWKVVPYNEGGPAISCPVWGFTTEESIAPSMFPYVESFEEGFGLWVQSVNDNFDWTRNSGYTPSWRTGPNSAHDGYYYIYTEASGLFTGAEAHLEGEFDLSNLGRPKLSLYYHMYGSTMGSLHIDIYDGQWHNSVWSISGQQQSYYSSSYQKVELDLINYNTAAPVTIRIRGVRGGGYRSDISIDMVEIYDGSSGNSVPSITAATPETGQQHNVRIWSYHDKVYISSENEVREGEVLIYNTMGQVIAYKDLQNKSLNVFPLVTEPGYYIVKVIVNDRVSVGKVFLFR